MKNYKHKTGVTLVEILIVIVIIAILAAIVIGTASRINTRAKERLAESTIALLNAALGEFRDYEYDFHDVYAGLKFPLDCNNFSETDLANELGIALGTTVLIPPVDHNDVYSGCEALYFFLSRVPESRKTLDKIDKSLRTCEDENGADMTISVGVGADAQTYPLFRVVDPWCITLRYSYYRNTISESLPSAEPEQTSPRAFPVITSAGPDKEFGTVDDITGR
ncbi:MAG: prepilin-type N-terminal cleavage/methylation domain-containing protein [Sedimentisphaerales bacterium]|nr:prepilin-type N-terminal cleavage/methylation domain-containing protein [Sedimentisphaerales bacterium]